MFPTSSSELALPETLHTKPNVRPRRSSRMTPSPHSSAALKPYTTCPTNQPAASRPTSRPTRGRANRSSTRTPELIVPTGPELQPSTSTEQPGIPNLTSQVTEGRAHSTSVNMPEPVLTGPEAQPLTSAEQSVTSNLNPRGRQSRSSVKTPQPLISTGPDLQPPTSTEQPVVPKSTSRTTRGRPPKSSVRTPESVVPTGSESLTSIEQPVIPKTRAARGRSSKPSIKTPEPIVPTGPELQPLTSAEQPVTPNLTSRASRGRSNKSIRTPETVVQTGPEFHPSTSSEQSDTPEPSSQGRTRRSVRTPEASVSTTPALQPSTSKKQPTPKPTALVTRGRTHKPSTEGLESVGPVAPDFEPPTSTDHLVTSKVTGQSLTLQSSPVSASPVSTTPELKPPVPIAQPLTLEPVPQTSHQRRRRATGKQGSRTAPVGPKSYSTPAEPEPQSSASQSSGASEAGEFITTTPDESAIPSMHNEAHSYGFWNPKEAFHYHRFTPSKTSPKTSHPENCSRQGRRSWRNTSEGRGKRRAGVSLARSKGYRAQRCPLRCFSASGDSNSNTRQEKEGPCRGGNPGKPNSKPAN